MTGRTFTVTIKEQSASVKCYRLAAHDGVLKLALLAGSRDDVYAVHSLLVNKGMVSCDGTYQGTSLPTVFTKRIAEYDTYVTLLQDTDNRCVWSPKKLGTYSQLLALFTTPLLPEWTEYVQGKLWDYKKIVPMKGFGTNAAYITAEKIDLDDIVSQGLKQKRIQIPQMESVA